MNSFSNRKKKKLLSNNKYLKLKLSNQLMLSAVETVSWTEKYRPLTLEAVIGHNDEVKEIRDFLENNQIDNWLLEGEPGSGKTTLAMIIATMFLDRQEIESEDIMFASIDFGLGKTIHKFNASKDRKLETIRDQIGEIVTDVGKKAIVLDEADMMTYAAQNAMRGMMESAILNQKMFILTCNHIDQIEDAIKSRCRILHINRLSDPEIGQGLLRILEAEEITFELDADTKTFLTSLIKSCEGDMRKAVQHLQRACVSGTMNVENYFFDVTIHQENSKKFNVLLDKVVSGGDWLGVDEQLTKMMFEDKKRLNPYQAVRDTKAWLIKRLTEGDISEVQYLLSLSAIKECDYRLTRSTTKYIQLEGMLGELRLIYGGYQNQIIEEEETDEDDVK